MILSRRRLIRSFSWMILGMTWGALVLAFFSAGDIYEYNDTVDGVHLPEVDAIVCLAGGRGRIATAGDLWYRYWEIKQKPLGVPASGRQLAQHEPPVLYVSGMGRHSNWNAVALQVRRGVLEVLKPGNVVLENESANTEENAIWLARHAKDQQWRRILLVTSRYHMKRAKFILEKVLAAHGVPLQIETLSVYQEPFEPGEWRKGIHGIQVTLTEYLKAVYYKVFWYPVTF